MNPQSWNMYAYVNNNPLNANDPSGMERFYDPWTGGGLPCYMCGGSGGTTDWGGGYITGDDPVNPSLRSPAPGFSPPIPGVPSGMGIPPSWAPGGGNNCDFGECGSNVIRVQDTAPQQQTLGGLPQISNIVLYYIARAYLMSEPGMASIINFLERSPNVYTIRLNHGRTNAYDSETNTVRWDPHQALGCTSGGTQSAASGLGHELVHARGRCCHTPTRRITTTILRKDGLYGGLSVLSLSL